MSQHDRPFSGAAFRSVRLLLLAWFSLLFFRLTLSGLGYNLSKRALRAEEEGVRPASPAFARRTALAVNRASRFVPRATCLVRAMAAKFLLDRKGYASSICVGVAKEAGTPLKAHAWLKSGDLIVVGDEERQTARYAPFMKSV
ncbi:lasso peptide biosynthesis B2 protein [Hyphococcus sp.]|jgi:hypothetical protein|uniref:lasso peptide biosynthesis B2 protein n=1 Tax=Hyphococcus sp. TaxID=2038636 RepID=UPI003D116DBB